MRGVIYTETVIYSAPPAFVADVPYQLVIVTLEDGTRVTGRVVGQRVVIDDRVELQEMRDDIPFFRKTS